MSVAEICYHMHASAFHVYGQLYEVISKGVARVAGELPESLARDNHPKRNICRKVRQS